MAADNAPYASKLPAATRQRSSSALPRRRRSRQCGSTAATLSVLSSRPSSFRLTREPRRDQGVRTCVRLDTWSRVGAPPPTHRRAFASARKIRGLERRGVHDPRRVRHGAPRRRRPRRTVTRARSLWFRPAGRRSKATHSRRARRARRSRRLPPPGSRDQERRAASRQPRCARSPGPLPSPAPGDPLDSLTIGASR